MPSQVTQEAFDGDAGHLDRLTSLSSDQAAAPLDLCNYAHDLLYTEIDDRLFVHLLPTCLRAWHDELRGLRTDYGGFVEHFYPVLAERHIFDTQLAPTQTAAVAQFMRSSILAEMDDQRGLAYRGKRARPYRWIGALTTYGVVLPDLELLWTRWWALETVGRAISLLQYVSALVYEDDNNLLFASWSPTEGGGPPCLWEFEGHLYEHRWLEPNVEFLKRTLSPSAVGDAVRRAVLCLSGAPEHDMAVRLESDVQARPETLKSRCAGLPTLLATRQAAGSLLAW